MRPRWIPTLAVLCLVGALPAVILAMAPPEDRCKAAKTKATGQKVLDEAMCHQRAIAKAVAVAPACLARTDDKFGKAIVKANSLGTCGGGSALETVVDQCIGSILTDAASPDGRCRAAKVKAAGQKVLAKARCHQRAILKAIAVDPGCLAKAEAKFALAVGKADAKGPCDGTVASLEAAVDQCVGALLAAFAPVCCTYGSFCNWAVDADSCAGTSVAGAPGTVCDSVTGDCIAPPANPGPCCQAFAPCGAGPPAVWLCGPNGTLHVTGICTPEGNCQQ
jgi:hypothetical protein